MRRAKRRRTSSGSCKSTLKEVMETRQFQAKLVALDQQPGLLIGDDLLREQRREREVWRKVATTRNIVLE